MAGKKYSHWCPNGCGKTVWWYQNKHYYICNDCGKVMDREQFKKSLEDFKK